MILNVSIARQFQIPRQPVLELEELWFGRPEIPSLLDLPHRVFTQSGRSALFLALQLSGIHPGDPVLVPTYHCPTMIAPVERLGGRPFFYPIRETGDANLEFIVNSCPPNTRAMLAVHFFGLPRPMHGLQEYCSRRGITLIEDCAHCFFGGVNGTAVGASGQFAIGSLPKFFPVLQGGILAWSSREVKIGQRACQPLTTELRAAWDALDHSASSGRLGPAGGLIRGVAALRRASSGAHRVRQDQLAVNQSPEELRQVSLADRLLEPRRIRRVDRWIVTHSNLARTARRRRENFIALAVRLEGLTSAFPLYSFCGPDHAPYVMPLQIRDADRAYARMREMRLPVFRWDRIWPGCPRIEGDAATQWAHGVVQIACHQSLAPAEIDRIAAAVLKCLQNAG